MCFCNEMKMKRALMCLRKHSNKMNIRPRHVVLCVLNARLVGESRDDDFLPVPPTTRKTHVASYPNACASSSCDNEDDGGDKGEREEEDYRVSSFASAARRERRWS